MIRLMGPIAARLSGPLALSMLLLSAAPSAAQARGSVSCDSLDGSYQYCQTDTRGGVRLLRQNSKAACIREQSWGYDRGGIWVDRGCRAEFSVGRDAADYGDDYDRRERHGRGDDDPGGRRLVCAADGYGYRHCPTDTRGGVRLLHQLSSAPCRMNDSWGYDRGGVWVDRGCRAEFEISHDGPPPRDRDDKDNTAAIVGGVVALGVLGAIIANQDKDKNNRSKQLITCASNGNAREYCRVDTGGGVRLHRQLSKSGCWQGQTWGYDRRGIWVSDGCRAEFEVRR